MITAWAFLYLLFGENLSKLEKSWIWGQIKRGDTIFVEFLTTTTLVAAGFGLKLLPPATASFQNQTQFLQIDFDKINDN